MANKKRDLVTIGIDLGGTKMKMALMNNYGNILSTLRYSTKPEIGSDGIIAHILSCVAEIQKKVKYKSPGIRTGYCRSSVSKGYCSFCAKPKLEECSNKTDFRREFEDSGFCIK
jgi:activator of 2-hydroxyglutaryl-CoA dehydratase